MKKINFFHANNKKRPGYVLVDVLLGLALLAIIIVFAVPAYIYGQEAVQLSGKRQRALNYANAGLEAVRGLRDASYDNIINGTYGLATSSSGFILNGTSDTDGEFTRQIVISDGDTPDRKDITANVTWNQNAQRSGTISLETRLNNWAKIVSLQVPDIMIVGTSSTPPDNGSQAGPEAVIVPPANIEVGDVVVLIAHYRGNVALSIGETGGQTWTSSTQQTNGTDNTARIFYAVFNGSWTANPSIRVTSGTLALTGVMHVFRYVDPGILDIPITSNSYASPNPPRNVPLPGVTTATDKSLVLAIWTSNDANAWSLQTSRWSFVSNSQYRNQTGNRSSISTAYRVFLTAGDTGNIIGRQQQLGGDPGVWFIMTLKQLF